MAEDLKTLLHKKPEESPVKEDAPVAASSSVVITEELDNLYGDRDILAEDIMFIDRILLLLQDLTKLLSRNSITASDKVTWAVRTAQASQDLEGYAEHLQSLMDNMDERIEEITGETD